MAVAQTQGTARLTCKNHPTYRWVQTKYVHPDHRAPGPYLGTGNLMFRGEEDGLPAAPWPVNEVEIKTWAQEAQDNFRRQYTPECACPDRDLVFLEWA